MLKGIEITPRLCGRPDWKSLPECRKGMAALPQPTGDELVVMADLTATPGEEESESDDD